MNEVQVQVNSFQLYIDKAVELAMGYAPKILLALLVLLVGLNIIGGMTRLFRSTLTKRNMDATLIPFLSDLLSWTLKAGLFISVAGIVGVKTTSFVALLGAAGLAVGLALQGTLANFAGGSLLLIFKPFKVGDLISAQGHTGVVEEIQIFVTKIKTPENKTVILPNGVVSNGTITNISDNEFLRIDHTVGIDYGADIKEARNILLKTLAETPHVLTEPAPFVGVTELADSSVNLVVRSFTKPEHYWDVYFGTLENAKIALDQAGIGIPFPQRDVHLFEHKA